MRSSVLHSLGKFHVNKTQQNNKTKQKLQPGSILLVVAVVMAQPHSLRESDTGHDAVC